MRIINLLFYLLVTSISANEWCGVKDVAENRFVREGTTFNLDKDTPGIVEGGYILWTKGVPTKSNPNCFDVVQQAYDQWANVPGCRLKFKYAGDNSTSDWTNTKQNLVMWSKTYPFESWNTLAITIFLSGRKVIVFNDNFDWSSNALLIHVAMHEIGHTIGLGHSQYPDAMMYYASSGKYTVLSDDDKVGAATLYPVPGYVPPVLPPPPPTPPPNSNFVMSPNHGPAPLAVMFSTSSNVSGVTYIWDFGDGIGGTGEVLNHTYTVAGSYIVKVTASSTNGVSETSQSIIVSPAFIQKELTIIKATLLFHFNSDVSSNKDNVCIAVSQEFNGQYMIKFGDTIFGECKISGGRGKSKVKVTGHSLYGVLNKFGAVNETISQPITIPVTIQAGGTGGYMYNGDIHLNYKAVKGKSGVGK